MNKTFRHQIVLIALLVGSFNYASAIPAPKKELLLSQPDGSKLKGRMVGDEFFHYAVSEDNYILLPDNKGFYTYAIPDSTKKLKPGKFIAKNIDSRSETDREFLKTIHPNMHFSDKQLNTGIENRIKRAIQINSRKSESELRNADMLTATNIYPTTGTVKSLVILVNFSDVKFKNPDASTFFSDMQNKKGFNYGKHIGSVRDFYMFNSSNKFTPDFTVIGPVTLDSTRSYYGENDENNEDKHPAKMVYDACMKVSSFIDFSLFDADSDGYVDNIYVYYAGLGEADGGSSETIWPHSWLLSGESLSLKLNGKIIDYYACSSELQDKDSITGIGPFVHEYGHILGLPDTYDVDYAINGQSFDLGEWSTMAYGGYNANQAVPPVFTVVERKLLGWISPLEINSTPLSISLPSIDSSNVGYIIKTSNSGEYYLLENRQNRLGSWDEYVLHHGMLIYHIDIRTNATTKVRYNTVDYTWTFSNIWNYNLVNAISDHQCIDIEEADNTRTLYTNTNYSSYYNSVKGDPFPGTSNITSFTDGTTPSMKTWDGISLDKSITNITETNGIISFDFKGGSNFGLTKPIIKPASGIGPFKFTASWKSYPYTLGYYLDIYKVKITATKDSVKTFLEGYENFYLFDTSLVINDLDDQTIYQYRVRAYNGFTTSINSDIAELTTPDATEIIAYVVDRTIYFKGIDKDSRVRIFNLARMIGETSGQDWMRVSSPGIYFAEAYINGQRKVIKLLVK